MEQPFDEFYKANVGLIHKVCQKVFKRVLSMGHVIEYSDLQQEASITMMKAYRGFNPDMGFKFSTYFTRAAFNDLNRYLRNYDRERSEAFQVSSMDAAVSEDGDYLNIEATIDGGHGSPEQVLEAAQLEQEINGRLSPLANFLLDLSIEPNEQMEREWERVCAMQNRQGAPMPMTFVNEFVNRLDPSFSMVDIKAARSEISSITKEFF